MIAVSARELMHMETSPAVISAIDRSLGLSEWISEQHPPTFIDVGNNKLAVALFSIALDHREAIVCLLQHGARTSAFALARPVFEAYVRGSWAKLCATEQQHERALTKGIMPSCNSMILSLNKVKGTDGVFSRAQILVWDALSDYTHGGMRQVIRWMGEGRIAPTRTDEEVMELLETVDSFSLLACAGIADVAGASLEPYVGRMKDLSASSRARKLARQASPAGD